MAQYPETFKEAVRDRYDIVDVISRHVQLRKSGANWMGLCPFHDDRKSPSFSVRPEKGVFHCFGCGASGDVFEFVMRIRGLGFQEALEALAQEANIPLPRLEHRPDDGERQRERDERQQLWHMLDQAKGWFRSNLQGARGNEARNYLAARGLGSATVERFQLGYAPPGWSHLLEHFGGGAAAGQMLETIGLAARREGREGWYDRFRDRIIFPIHDRQGRCIAFGGRLMKAGDGPKYINSPETPLYRKGETLYGLDIAWKPIREADTVLVVEGYMDLIALVDAGIGNVVATLGTAMTGQHLRLLWSHAHKLVFCFDGDPAGKKAAWRALEQVMDGLEADRHPLFLFLPEGEDPDEAVRREGVEQFRRRMRDAMPLLDFLLNHLAEDLVATTPEGKAALVRRAQPHLAKVADPLLRNLYSEALHQRLGLTGLWQGKPQRRGFSGVERTMAPAIVATGRGRDHEQLLLAILLRFPELLLEHEESFSGLMLKDPLRERLLEELVRFCHQPGAENIRPLDCLNDPPLVNLARQILHMEEQVLEDPKRELQGCLIHCQLARIRQEMNRLSATGFQDEKDWSVYHGYRLEEARLLSKIKA